ncbi:hypothetical protein K0M31_003481 [Melipona bicolor]|uniref:Uncharacterized protein n=1 Tax=Melipona bicolor TaxID=60889 RepID=A0AA40KPI8_9HYME|nr:hypothetical protein K0M31_003481 [Melipona bicolor]
MFELVHSSTIRESTVENTEDSMSSQLVCHDAAAAINTIGRYNPVSATKAVEQRTLPLGRGTAKPTGR